MDSKAVRTVESKEEATLRQWERGVVRNKMRGPNSGERHAEKERGSLRIFEGRQLIEERAESIEKFLANEGADSVRGA